MHELTTGSPGQTRALGERLAQQLLDADVLLLSGEMGAGKSEFCRGLARGLGIAGPIPSPSFTILNVYEEGRLPFRHFDWYRVADAEELIASGLDEMIGHEGITAIEWHARAPELLPQDCLEIEMEYLDGDARRVRFKPRGTFRALRYEELLLHEEDRHADTGA